MSECYICKEYVYSEYRSNKGRTVPVPTVHLQNGEKVFVCKDCITHAVDDYIKMKICDDWVHASEWATIKRKMLEEEENNA